MSAPSISTLPLVDVSKPASIRSSVVLPHPGTAEQAEDLAAVDPQGDVVDGGDVAELLRYALDPNGELGPRAVAGVIIVRHGPRCVHRHILHANPDGWG